MDQRCRLSVTASLSRRFAPPSPSWRGPYQANPSPTGRGWREAPAEARSVIVFILFCFFLVWPRHAKPPRVALEPTPAVLSTPVFFTNAKDGTNRRFVIEQVGRIRVLQPGSSDLATFLDITGRVLFNGEQGLLG